MATIRNETTRKTYIERLWLYCAQTQMTPQQLIKEKAESLQNSSLRGLAEDRLIKWHNGYERKAPGVAVNVFKAVRSFFKSNYLPLGCKIPTYIKQREEDYIPTKAEVTPLMNKRDKFFESEGVEIENYYELADVASKKDYEECAELGNKIIFLPRKYSDTCQLEDIVFFKKVYDTINQIRQIMKQANIFIKKAVLQVE